MKSSEPIRLLAQASGVPQSTSVAQKQPTPAHAAASPGPEALLTRSFRFDPVMLRQELGALSSGQRKAQPGTGASAEDLAGRLRTLFAEAGVDLASPKSLIWNERSGRLFVRATERDLATIEEVLKVLNAPPPQLTVDVKFAEIDEGQDGAFEFYKLMGMVRMVPAGTNSLTRTTSVPPPDPAAREVMKGGVRLQSLSNAEPAVISGVLKPAQFRLVVRALEQRRGVSVLSCPKVTTLSGRQAQIKTVSVKYVVTDLDRSKEGKPQPISEPMEFGPTLDVVPDVNADGKTILLTVIPTVKEFLGYDVAAGERFDAQNPVPLPVFRLRQAVASANVQDGQTLVLSPGTVEAEQKSNENPNAPATKTRKTLVIFVTPTIIDAAGNRVHPPEEPEEESAAPAPVRAIPRP